MAARRRTSPERARPADTVLLLIQAIVLGILQGLTEFLPVSSSGHLQGVPYLLGWASGSLMFDVMVHLGTLIAVLVYFRADLWRMATDSLGISGVSAERRRDARVLVALLALGTVPAVVAGLLFGEVFEAAFASPRVVAVFLYVTALTLWAAERIRTRRLQAAPVAQGVGASEGTPADDGQEVGRGIPSLRSRDAVAIGVAQAFAIFPGVSRSGATIAVGMSLGLSRLAAARFSFLLSIPVILGATVFAVMDLGSPPADTPLPFGTLEVAVGVVVAAASGYWAIRFLIDMLARRGLMPFAAYVTIFATVLMAATFVR